MIPSTAVRAVCSAFLLSVAFAPAAAQAQLSFDAELLGDGGGSTAPGDGFGRAVSTDGTIVAIGIPGYDGAGANVGGIGVYRNSDGTWRREAVLTPTGAETGVAVYQTAVATDTVVACSNSRTVSGVLGAGTCWVFEFDGADWINVQTIEPSTPSLGLGFGSSVSIAGNRMAVGAASDSSINSGVGSVYLYTHSGDEWQFETILRPSDGGRFDTFGTAVALADEATLAVGSPGADTNGENTGAAYVYRHDGGWQLSSRLVPPGATENDQVGASVGFADGNTLAVGAPRWDEAGEDSGSIHIFSSAGGVWSHAATLLAPEGTANAWLGSAVATAGDFVAGGAPFQFSETASEGFISTFIRSGNQWTFVGTLRTSNSTPGAHFGSSLAIDREGSVFVAGAPTEGTNGPGAGAAYVFEGYDSGVWGGVSRIEPMGSGALDHFGLSVAGGEDLVVVGAPLDDHSGLQDAGAAYVYRRYGSTWELESKLISSSPAAGENLGISVATDDTTILVGAPAADSQRGAVGVFTRGADGWQQIARLTASDRSRGDGFGISVAIDGNLAAVASRAGQAGYIFEWDGTSWHEAARLTPQEPSSTTSLSSGSVDIHGDLVALGYPSDPVGASVSLLRMSQGAWDLEDVIREPDANQVFFGSPVCLTDDLLITGSRRDDAVEAAAGRAWVYRRLNSEWTFEATLTDSHGHTGDEFGTSVAVGADDMIFVGAPQADVRAGRVVTFAHGDEGWVEIQRLAPPEPNNRSGAFGSAVDGVGSGLVAGAPLRPSALGAPEVGSAFVFSATTIPTAAFTWSPSVIADGQLVAFRDLSQGRPTSWSWDFGDGVESTEANPTHTYLSPGAYDVILSVSNDIGSDQDTQRVTILPAQVTAGFAWSPAFPEPGQLLQFRNTTRGAATSFEWEFGDGATSTETAPSHSYADQGDYLVRLQASGPFASDSVEYTVTVGGGNDYLEDSCIPAVARVQGAGAFFTSRVDLYNPGTAPLEVEVVYTPRSDIPGSDVRTVVPVGAEVLLEVDDPLGSWFGFSDSESAVGALRFRSLPTGNPVKPLAQSVVLARNIDGSEYGQFFPAMTRTKAIPGGATEYIPTTVDAQRTRVNLGVMALEDSTNVSVRAVDPIGNPLSDDRVFALNAGESTQLNDVSRRLGLGEIADYLMEVEVDEGLAVAYVSVLDGNADSPGTSDPTTQLPLGQGSDSVVLLELGPIIGFDEFSGSASISNLGADDLDLTAAFFERGTPGIAHQQQLSLAAGDTLGFVDLVGDLFGITGVGTVMVTGATGSRIAATGREYAIFRDAQGKAVGTAGQLIAGETEDDLLLPGTTYHLLGLRQRATDAGLERSHIAAFNPGSAPAIVQIRLFDAATSTFEGAIEMTVRPQELVQRNNIINVLSTEDDDRVKRLEVVVDHPVHLRGFRVNAWADPITISPLR